MDLAQTTSSLLVSATTLSRGRAPSKLANFLPILAFLLHADFFGGHACSIINNTW